MVFTKDSINDLINLLEKMYPNAHCELNYDTPFELLVAVILSAQCTDKRVNEVTKVLFQKYSTVEEFSKLDQQELEKYIFTCGFYRNKAKNIISCSKTIVDKFGGVVPNTIEELVTLDGVGRKTANVVFSEAFHGQAIAVDTHVLRVSNRLGFIKSQDPEKVEQKLMKIIPKDKWSRMHHLLIFHGRYLCHARNPKCENCEINKYCKRKV